MPCCSPPSSASTTRTMAGPAAEVVSPKVHLHLHVRDLTASVNFYRLLFGTEPVKLLPGYAKFLPTWGPVNLALSQSDAEERGSVVGHVGVQLGSPAEVQRQLTRVAAAGLPMRIEMGVDCCHANADKFWVIDPAGVAWEIYCLNYDLDASVSATEPVCTTTCCPA